MKQLRFVWTTLPLLFALLAVPAITRGEEEAAAEPTKVTVEQLNADPNDIKLVQKYLQEQWKSATELAKTDAKAAVKQIETAGAALADLQPTEDAAKAMLTRLRSSVAMMEDRFSSQAWSLEEIKAEIAATPEDAVWVKRYGGKVYAEYAPKVRSDWKEIKEPLQAEVAYLEKIAADADSDEVKAAAEQSLTAVGRLTRSVEMQQRLAELVGKPAAPLLAKAWVNGAPLTDEELKGKVVLLDFFAIWCGPCIASFPHIREWNEHYADKGLVVIGVTGYYGYDWDEEKKRPMRSQEEVSPETEQAMLQKFAASHELKYPIAVDPEKNLSKYYAVSAIPQVVVIDREGLVQLVQVGSGDASAKAIEAKIKELLGEG
ncbi:TlpA family protein disulfide reductase [Blastopirellula marina]|uniref:Thioredoxin domain-containing protein n=1 Tax=Blastopirellula marina TaxID=124 RepID=A0A2S8GTH7_9BACT|nr:TlpA disulfide reductase family protein [Blastopirellula marina]PQO47723.1 hypothetical protein C5Y93_03450 [Blastopirellula marina]